VVRIEYQPVQLLLGGRLTVQVHAAVLEVIADVAARYVAGIGWAGRFAVGYVCHRALLSKAAVRSFLRKIIA